MRSAVVDQNAAQMLTAAVLRHAELSDVRDVLTYPRTEQHTHHLMASGAHQYAGSLCIEQSAAGETDDVVQKAQRPGDGAVLVVDVAIQMALVSGGDQMGRRIEVVFMPLTHLQ